MKYIEKNPEPESLKQWREKQLETGVNFTYENFRNPEKSITKQSLLDEQGFICCYCCQRINDRTSHIEHFSPQSKSDPILTVTYNNMLASCGPLEIDSNDAEKKTQWPKHCGNQRQNIPLPIAPQFDTDCEGYFTYTSNGEIVPVSKHPRQKDAQEMIDVLQLNNPDLVLGRKGVLQALTGLTEAEAQLLWQLNSTKNQNGEFRSFCPAVLNVLRQNFNLT